MKYTAFIGLGSNLTSVAGTPEETVRTAIAALAALGTVVAQSSLYRTSPVGFREQPDFINAVVRLDTDLEPESLLRELLAIERSLGRDREKSVPKGPRTVDLDLLLVFAGGNAVVDESPALTLPHPEIAARRFVLEPLAEIAPDLLHPVLRNCARELLEELLGKGKGAEEDVTRL